MLFLYIMARQRDKTLFNIHNPKRKLGFALNLIVQFSPVSTKTSVECSQKTKALLVAVELFKTSW